MRDNFNLAVTVLEQIVLNDALSGYVMSGTGTNAYHFVAVTVLAGRTVQERVVIDLVTSGLAVVIESHDKRDALVILTFETAVVDSVVLPEDLHPVVLMAAVWGVVVKNLCIG